MFQIMLDLQCLEAGIPPLSLKNGDVIRMIDRLESKEKRAVVRKIKKLAKTEVTRRCAMLKKEKSKTEAKSRFEKMTTSTKRYQNLSMRITLARSLMTNRTYKTMSSEG